MSRTKMLLLVVGLAIAHGSSAQPPTWSAGPLMAAAVAVPAASDTVAVEIPVPWDEIGTRLAAKAAERIAQEIKKHGKSGLLWGLTGDLKPSSEAWYTRTLPIKRDGRAGWEMLFGVKARLKLDAFGGPFTTKIAAVETVQTIAVRIFPIVRDGKPLVEVSAEVLSATAKKERKARQAHADKLRDAVRTAITDFLRENVNRQVDVLSMLKGRPGVPQDIDKLRIVNRIDVHEKSLTVHVGQPGSGGASLDVPTSVSAPGRVTLFQHKDFGGKSVTLSLADFAAGKANKVPPGWNDTASSAKWDLAPGVTVTLYQHNPPKGHTFAMRGSGEDRNFRNKKFNDSASSWGFTR